MAKPPEEEKRHSKLLSLLAFAVPAAVAFALARRPSLKNMTPSQQRLAKLIRQRGLMRATNKEDMAKGPLADVKNYLQYGTTKLFDPLSMKNKKPVKAREVVYSPIESREKLKGRANVGMGTQTQKPVWDADENKATEAFLFNRFAPGAMAESLPGSSIPKQLRKPGVNMTTAEKLNKIQEYLKTKFPKGYIVKGIDDAQSAGQLATENVNLAEVYKKLKGTLASTHARDLVKHPEKVLVQERIPIARQKWYDRALLPLGSNLQPTQEFRVHAIGPRVMRSTSFHRFGPLSSLLSMAGFKTPDMQNAENFVAKQLLRLPKDFVKNRSFAFDVAQTPEGALKVIESNPGGYSGFLHPTKTHIPQAVASHRMVSELQGRDTAALAAAKALMAGTAGYGAAAGYNKLTEEIEPNT